MEQLSVETTPLHVAAAHGDAHAVRALLAKGAVVDAPNYVGLRPLHFAAAAGSVDVVCELLAAGAAVELAGGGGIQPIHCAIRFDWPAVVQVLLDATDSTPTL